MTIFNSLGSNYNLWFLLKSLPGASPDVLDKLKQLLEKRYGGKAILFYKGREAMSAVLEILKLPKGSEVAINGFTCIAVFNAIRTAGYEPKCIDIEKDNDPNFSSSTLEKTVRLNENIKAVVVQNTFGYPCNIEGIERVCKKHKIILIEDLAHCVGTKYSNGKEAGTVGDFVILSFSQDKIIDAVSGGALLIRNKNFSNIKFPGVIANCPRSINVKERLYPHLAYKIRYLYNLGVGKPYHFLLRKLNLMSNVMNKAFYDYYRLPNWNAGMALYQFKLLGKQLEHRKKIATIYAEDLDKSVLIDSIVQTIELSSNLRFSIFVENRPPLVKLLKQHGVYLSDIWYHDVAPECPNAVNLSQRILNLPTHINVSEKDAQKICKLINDFVDKEVVRS